jgi:MFS family permease
MDRIRAYGRDTFASLKIRNYSLYFYGQAISLCGTWMQTVALGWLVLQLTGSGTELGGVLAFQFVPILFLGPWGGLIVDRFHKRTLLYWTQSASAILALLLGLLVFTNTAQIWMIYIFALCLGMIKVIDNPARQTFVSEMVGTEHVRNAVTLNSTASNLARVIGPSIGGVLIALFGIAASFFINALSFGAVLFMLFLIRDSELYKTPRVPKSRGQLKDGWQYVLQTPLLRDTLVVALIIGTFSYEFQVSLPLLAKVTFAGNAASYAALLAALGLGSVIGGLYAAGRKKTSPHALMIATFLFGASMIAAALTPTFFFALCALVFVGFFSINVTSLANTMLQLESVPAMRGRVLALWSMAIFGSTAIGAPAIGYISEYWGPRAGLAAGGIAALCASIFAVMTLLQKDREIVISESVALASREAVIEEDSKFA